MLDNFEVDLNRDFLDIPVNCESLGLHNITQEKYDGILFKLKDKNIKTLILFSGRIQNLIIPEGVEYAICDELGIENVDLPESLETIYLNDNCLLSLELPTNIVNVEVKNNGMRHLKTKNPGNNSLHKLQYLNVVGNKIKELVFDPSDQLMELDIEANAFTEISPKIKEIATRNKEKAIKLFDSITSYY